MKFINEAFIKRTLSIFSTKHLEYFYRKKKLLPKVVSSKWKIYKEFLFNAILLVKAFKSSLDVFVRIFLMR